MLVYDITKRQSFFNIEKWLKEVKANSDAHCIIILIGNKCDLEIMRKVTINEGKELAQKNGLFFMETSAKDNINVEQAFLQLIEEISKVNPLLATTTTSMAPMGADATSDHDQNYHHDKDERRNLMNTTAGSDALPKSGSGCCILS